MCGVGLAKLQRLNKLFTLDKAFARVVLGRDTVDGIDVLLLCVLVGGLLPFPVHGTRNLVYKQIVETMPN